MTRTLNEILKDLYAHFNYDKERLIQFCLDRGHNQKDIAKALDVTETAISKFITRHKLVRRTHGKTKVQKANS